MAITGTAHRGTGPDGEAVFTKTLADAPPLFFRREAAGLRALRAAGARVPEVLDVTDEAITLSWVEQGGERTAASEEQFGQELAALHLDSAQGPSAPDVSAPDPEPSPTFGSVDGEPTAYLGACPVDLTTTETWHESWVERRVVPLARRAAEQGALNPAAAALAERISPDHLGPSEPAALLHGDLWGGNRLVDSRGRSWLIDPCAQLGHREVDLAMMQLFGGFSGRVFAAYVEAHPLADGWQERVAVYQTVPLLVHAILFGGGYGVQAGDALREAAG
ncbi:fructosamine kinase family protein [Ornithinimicrobium sufpigmenti]|uniref:fructosamine kinase family protein n=1 Tax=Ornithinimicrobium sufpigmenti TaxID=2508882 RepID=UPI001EE0DFD7|nr:MULTISPECIES: fructosamine kinase family protein [unclassified Ornithinimicrobium]